MWAHQKTSLRHCGPQPGLQSLDGHRSLPLSLLYQPPSTTHSNTKHHRCPTSVHYPHAPSAPYPLHLMPGKLHTPPNHHHHPKSSSTQHFVSTHCHYHCSYSAFSATQIIHHSIPTSPENTFQFDTHLEASVLNTSHIPQYPLPAPLNFTIYPSLPSTQHHRK